MRERLAHRPLPAALDVREQRHHVGLLSASGRFAVAPVAGECLLDGSLGSRPQLTVLDEHALGVLRDVPGHLVQKQEIVGRLRTVRVPASFRTVGVARGTCRPGRVSVDTACHTDGLGRRRHPKELSPIHVEPFQEC